LPPGGNPIALNKYCIVSITFQATDIKFPAYVGRIEDKRVQQIEYGSE
jgi:hypothetical protein